MTTNLKHYSRIACALFATSWQALSEPAPGNVAGDTTPKEAVKPMWILDGKPFEEPSRPNPLLRFLAATATGQLVFAVYGTSSDVDARTELVVVKGKSGEIVKRVEIPKAPSGKREWMPASAPSGEEQVLISMVQWREDERKERHATLALRKFDAGSGKLSDAKTMSFADPTTSEESGPVAWGGDRCVGLRAFGRQAIIFNSYFIAEFDLDSLKLLRSQKLNPGPVMGEWEFLDKGAKWSVRGTPKNYFSYQMGSAPKKVTEAEYNAMQPGGLQKAAARVNKEGKFLEVAKSEDSTWHQVELEIPDSLQWVTTDYATGKVLLAKVVAARNFYCAIPLE